jgi:hypothetical protein
MDGNVTYGSDVMYGRRISGLRGVQLNAQTSQLKRPFGNSVVYDEFRHLCAYQ